MANHQKNSPPSSIHKDRTFVLQGIQKSIENGAGKPIPVLRQEHTEEHFFYLCLRYVTTTKKALCEAVGIPVEAGCRYKRRYEKDGLLVQSTDEVVCPLTRHGAHLLSTNPDEFEELRRSNQLKLF